MKGWDDVRGLFARIRSLLRALRRRSGLGAEMDEEFEAHIEMRTEDLIRSGMEPKEAARRARLEFGSREQYREEGREARGLRHFDELRSDLRYAARSLRKSPGFTAAALLTLALGIGASSAMFSVVDAVLLRPLGYDEAERLAVLSEVNPRGEENVVSAANFSDWREQARSFEHLAGWLDTEQILTGDREAEEVPTRFTTGSYFQVLGASPLLGRTYTEEEVESGEPVVVLGHRLWTSRFGADPAVVGRSITLNEQPVTVIGVMPRDFPSIGGRPDLWVPMSVDPEWRGRYLDVIGRLIPDATLEEARVEMATIGQRLADAYPEFNKGWGVRVTTVRDAVAGDVRPALLILLSAVGLLLLIACANVANLLLSRASSRQKEVAVRRALGATRGRLVRQLLTESSLLAVLAGALGLAFAVAGTHLLVLRLPTELALPRMGEIGVDMRVVAFTAALSLMTAVLFGLAPALFGSSTRTGEVMRESSRGTTAGAERSRLRSALVVAEVALALLLLAGAGLLGRSFQKLASVDPGLDTEQVLAVRVAARSARYQDPASLVDFSDRLLERLEAVPGVQAAGIIGPWLPLTGNKSAMRFRRDDLPPPPVGEEPSADIRLAGGDYFRAAGIPLQRGRVFDERDTGSSPDVVIVNEALADRDFPGEDAVGKRITFEWYDTLRAEIVGVVGDVREMGPAAEASPAIYIPFQKRPDDLFHLVVRTAGDPAALAGAVADAASSVDPDQPFTSIRSMERVAGDAVAGPQLNLLLLGGFAAIALVLATIGLYGVIAYSVSQRRQEIGVRVALGADRSDVLRLVVGQGMRLTVLGLLLGLAGALAVTRLMTSMLFGVEPTDPLTLAAVAGFLGATALLATWLPARRAAKTDAMLALRVE